MAEERVKFCFLFCAIEGEAKVVDSFCSAYQQVIRKEGEGKISAPLSVKKRIAANEILYQCRCEGRSHPLCGPKS